MMVFTGWDKKLVNKKFSECSIKKSLSEVIIKGYECKNKKKDIE